jgi:hypothetical protein
MKKTGQNQRKEINDVVTLISRFQETVLENKPSLPRMYADIRMMKFKVRPLNGEFSNLDFKNETFLETLWSIGKLDDFYQSQVNFVSPHQKEIFHRLFNEMYNSYHQKLNKINLRPEEIRGNSRFGFELEIFRENRQSATKNRVVN